MDYKTWLSGTKSQDIYEFYHSGPIVRGTVQEHSFKLPSYIIPTKLTVAYKQGSNIILKKDIEIGESLIYSVKLSEIDTLKFKANKETKVQLKIETEDSLLVSDKFSIQVENSIDDTQVTTNDEVYAIEVQVNKCQVKAYDYFNLVNGIDLKCKFNLDGNWKDFEPKAYFNDSYNHLYAVSLKNNICTIPEVILEKPGVIHVGIYNKSLRSTIWSNPIRLKSAVTFVPNDETKEPTKPSFDLTNFYYGTFETVPSTLDQFKVVPDLDIADLLKNGYSIEAGGENLLFFACDSKFKVVKIIMEDTFELTPPEDEDADYACITTTDFNMYYMLEKTFDSAKYTLYFEEATNGN